MELTDEGDIDSYETYYKLTEKDSFDITSNTFLNNKKWTKYLTSNQDRGFGIWFANDTVQPYAKNATRKDFDKLKDYVTSDKYFTASLVLFAITNTLSTPKNPYFTAILATYVSTYVCGTDAQHLEYNDHTPSIITSMVRYHLYYQISKFLEDPSRLERYIAHVPRTIQRHKPTTDVWSDAFDQGSEEINTWLGEQKDRRKIRNYKYHKNPRGYVTGITYQKVTGQSPNDANDYKMFIATTTDGLTKIRQKLFQQSIESYVYAVLGAQAKTRWAIVGEDAKSLQTQDVFRTIVKETIAQSDVTITLSNMRTAIASTNVVLSMAISQGMILVPSDLIIQKEKIPGYNNVLTLATEKMKFGENTDMNYKAPPVTTQEERNAPLPKTIQGVSKTETTSQSDKVIKTVTTTGGSETLPPSKTSRPGISPGHTTLTPASEVLGVTMMIGGFLISKYIL